MAVLTTTLDYPNDLFRINAFFNGVGQGSVRYTSSTTIVLGTSDLNRVVINGYGFQYDRKKDNPWVAGTITSISLWDSGYERKVAEIGGLNHALSELGLRFGIDMYSEQGLVSYLFGGADILSGSANRDSFYGYNGDDTVNSGAGDDDITPGAGSDLIDGGEGYDIVSYWDFELADGDENSQGVSVDLGGPSVQDPWGAQDRFISIEGIEGTYYADSLRGNGADNSLYGLRGNDKMYGLGGSDFFSGGEGADTMDGGAGFDTVSYVDYAGPGSINVNLETGQAIDPWGQVDILFDIEVVRGTGNADTIVGSSRDETFQGMGGDDVFTGGAGTDAVSYSADKSRAGLSGVNVDLVAGTAQDGFGSTDRFSGIEDVYGSQLNDRIVGSSETNTLMGYRGNDMLNAGAGNDWLYGGDGSDTLTGGTGRDGFVFNTAPNKKTNVDRIIDYSVKNDTIYLDDAVFKKLKRGYLSSGAFQVGSKAQDKSDRIIYDKKTGALYYDPDGTGGSAQIKFATLAKHLKLKHSEFSVY